MKRNTRIMTVLLVISMALIVVFMGRNDMDTEKDGDLGQDSSVTLPRLVDLGSNKCIPCKKMAPILAELDADYAQFFVVEVIDVGEHPEASTEYGIRIIPTQIFYGNDGGELWRHEGFIGKDAILSRWDELGVSVTADKVAR